MRIKRFVAAFLSLVLTFGLAFQLTTNAASYDHEHFVHHMHLHDDCCDCDYDHTHNFDHEDFEVCQEVIDIIDTFVRDFQIIRTRIMIEMMAEADFRLSLNDDESGFAFLEDELAFISSLQDAAAIRAFEILEKKYAGLIATPLNDSLCCDQPWILQLGSTTFHNRHGNVCTSINVMETYQCRNCRAITTNFWSRPGCGPQPNCW